MYMIIILYITYTAFIKGLMGSSSMKIKHFSIILCRMCLYYYEGLFITLCTKQCTAQAYRTLQKEYTVHHFFKRNEDAGQEQRTEKRIGGSHQPRRTAPVKKVQERINSCLNKKTLKQDMEI